MIRRILSAIARHTISRPKCSWSSLTPPPEQDWANLNPHALFRELTMGVEYVHSAGVDGHIAEFGTAWGRTAEALARALDAYSALYAGSDQMHGIGQRILWLFDSFEGFPEATNEADKNSPHIKAGLWGAGTAKVLTEEQLARKCAKFLGPDRVLTFKGWFSESMSRIPAGTKFALVHIDADLYQSTFDVLDYLFAHDHFADGCALFFDDWNCNRASNRFGQRKAWIDAVEKHRPNVEDASFYGINSKRFLVHC